MQGSIKGIQRQIHCLKDINDQGEGTTNYWGLRRNWKYLYYKKQFLEDIKPATFYLNTAIIQIVSGLCRFLEFITGAILSCGLRNYQRM